MLAIPQFFSAPFGKELVGVKAGSRGHKAVEQRFYTWGEVTSQ